LEQEVAASGLVRLGHYREKRKGWFTSQREQAGSCQLGRSKKNNPDRHERDA
jgi:hypothetical protein